MAPWWLRGSEDEVYDDARADQASAAGREDEDAGREPDAPAPAGRSARQERTPEDAGRPPDPAPARQRKRRRRRKRSSSPPDSAGPRAMGIAAAREVSGLPPPAMAPPPFPAIAATAAVDERRIAMLCDLENLALGVRDSEIKKLEIHLILERLLEKGKIIVKRAYADWERYSEYKRPCHEAAIELIDIPRKFYSGKNSADIKMVVDAMDLCYSKEHLDTFAIVSGDSDFSPLVSKLKENNKYVIGLGVRNASSNLLIDNCDEFVFYEDVWRVAHRGPRLDHLSPKETEIFGLMSDAMLALMRENKDVLWGSMLKQTMQRKRPAFTESSYGYGSFSELLIAAERKGIIGLRRDERSGSWIVTGFAKR